MGDRALVCFKGTRDEYSPVIYLHWAGNKVPELLKEHAKLMKGRDDDPAYAAARFCGICHAKDPNSNTSIGINDKPADLKPETLKEASHGDAGFILVDTVTWTWKAYGGYLGDNENPFPNRDDGDDEEAE